MSPPDCLDAIVVGAGPAGCASAIHLSRTGARVTLIDKATFPRDKFCGDGLTAGARHELARLDLDPHTIASWQEATQCVVRAPNGKEASFPLAPDRHLAAVARRIDLDAALVERARRSGVEVLEGCALRRVVVEAHHVTVEAGADRLRARYVIGADGMWSPLRKHLGLAEPGYRGDWHAFRQYFTGVTGRASRDLVVWFEPDLLPGYAWAFPLPGGVSNVGFGIRRGGRRSVHDMKQLWPELLRRPHIRAALGPDACPEAPHRAWPIPARVDRVRLTGPRALFVGDAAAATDPMTGEGIGQALLTGRLAAAAIAAGGEVEHAYEQQVRRHLFADHRLAANLVRVLARERGADWAVRLAGANGWTRREFARWLFEDYPRALAFTPRRWRQGKAHAGG